MEYNDPTHDKDTDLEPANKTSDLILFGCLCGTIVFAVIGFLTVILGIVKAFNQ
jgi:hypothetical protein